MDGFKDRYIDGKQYDYNSDLKDEINQFSADNEIDKNENIVLRKILDYNLVKKNREKLVINRTSKERLQELMQVPGLVNSTKRRISNILSYGSLSVNEKNDVKNSKYIDSNGKLKNVRKITLMKLVSLNQESINSIIGNKYNFSITNKKGETFNVFLGSMSNGVKNYYYGEGPKKNQRVRIYDGYKLGPKDGTLESNAKIGDNFDSPEGYNTIDNPEQLKLVLEKRDITKRDIDKWLKKGNKTIRLRVDGKRDRVSVKELDRFYKEFISAQNYSRKSIKKGVGTNREKVDYKAMRDYGNESIDKLSGIAKFIAIGDKYLSDGITERNLKHLQFLPKYLHAEEKKAIRKSGRGLKKNAWCAYFINTVLEEAGYPTLSNSVAGASRAYIGESGYGHIGIKKGLSMINGNTGDSIGLSRINFSKLRGWILPQHVGQPKKAHKGPFNSKTIIPDGAILVYGRNPRKKSDKKWA